MRQPHRQTAFIAGRLLLRQVLGKADITLGENGKPYFAVASAPGFNLSHSGKTLVLAVNYAGAIGADVETRSTRRDALGIARRYFHPSEAASLASLPAAEQRDAFLTLWTLKEAALKAIGQGICDGMHYPCFDIPAALSTERIHTEFRDAPTNFFHSKIDARTHLALAWTGSKHQKIRWFRHAHSWENGYITEAPSEDSAYSTH